MKKNAFSLVELIASIVILSILIAVGVRIFTNVRKNVLEKQYQNIYMVSDETDYQEKTVSSNCHIML